MKSKNACMVADSNQPWDYTTLNPKTLTSVGQILGVTGEAFDRELNQMIRRTQKKLSALPEFTVWMAEALVWARFAARNDAFFLAAAGFIAQGDPKLLDDATQYPGLRPDHLRDALAAFRRWYEVMTKSLCAITPEPIKWEKLQRRSLNVVLELKKKGELRGVGMWLFPAPFKIMAVAHPETWKDKRLNDVVMPTGAQVERALWMLHKDGVIKIDQKILAGSVGTFVDEYTNLWTFQRPQQDLAEAGESIVLHINGALHELGKRGS